MGLHICPIEPDDWSNGNGEEGNCRACDGTGVFSREAGCIDGIYYPEIQDATCESCGGTGFVDYEPLEDDVI